MTIHPDGDKIVDSLFVRRVRVRLWRQNRNYLICLTGKVGTGKSYAAISLAMQIDKKFDVKTQLVFSAIDFIKLINSGNIRRGSVVVFDEIAIEYNSRDAMTKRNKQISAVLSTFRNLNLCLITTVPFSDLADTHQAKFTDMLLESRGIDYHNKVAHFAPYEVSYHQRRKKTYFTQPHSTTETGEEFTIDIIEIGRPPVWVTAVYEKMKKEFTTQLNLKIERELTDDVTPHVRKETNVDIVRKLLLEGKKNKDIVNETGMYPSQVSNLKSKIKAYKPAQPIT